MENPIQRFPSDGAKLSETCETLPSAAPPATARLAVARPAPPAPAPFLCRSMLTTCGLHPRQYDRAHELGADVALLDLEDSVPPASRESARLLVLPFLAAAGQERPAGFTWALRINSIRTEDGLRDVLALVESGARPGALLLPKMEAAEDVAIYDELLRDRLTETAFFAIIETASGLAAAERIATASPRVKALMFGAADFSADLGSDMSWEAMAYARARIVAAAATAGILAIDSPCFEIEDGCVLRAEAERARKMGFSGKVAIHPRQVEPINEEFTPSPAAIARAFEVLAAFDRSRGQICVVDGQMIGPPLVIAARRTLARAGKLSH